MISVLFYCTTVFYYFPVSWSPIKTVSSVSDFITGMKGSDMRCRSMQHRKQYGKVKDLDTQAVYQWRVGCAEAMTSGSYL